MENTAGKTGEEQKREEGEHYQSFSLFQSPPGLLKILVCCYGSASSFPSPPHSLFFPTYFSLHRPHFLIGWNMLQFLVFKTVLFFYFSFLFINFIPLIK